MTITSYIKSNLPLKNTIKKILPDFILSRITQYKYEVDAQFHLFYTQDNCQIRFHLGALEDNRGIGRVAKEQFTYMKHHLLEKSPSNKKQKIVHFYSSIHWCPKTLPQNSIVMIHDVIPMVFPDLFKPQYQEWTQRFYHIAHQAQYIITISQTSKQDIIKYLDIPEDKIIIVNNGVTKLQIPQTSQLDLPKDYFVYLGSYDRHKNLDIILETLALPQNKHFKLLMIGDNKLCMDKVKQLSIEDQVRFLGRLDDNDTAFVIKNAIALLFPSLYEGFGLPPMEAALLHTSSICSNRPTMNEFLTDVCLFSDPNDTKSWSKNMQLLYDNLTFRTQLSKKAYDRVSNFTWEKSSKKLVSILKENCTYIEETPVLDKSQKQEQSVLQTIKIFIKSIPLVGFALRWFYNLIRLNNTKHNLFILQQQFNQHIQHQEQKYNEILQHQEQKYNEILQHQEQKYNSLLNKLIEQKHTINQQLQEQDTKQLHTANQLQKLQDDLHIPDIPDFAEIKTQNYLQKSFENFPYTKEQYKKFKESELYYSLFENIFYNHEVVLQKQKVYLKYIPKTNSQKHPHLDIGCGRGEFLTNLKEKSIVAKGIDINSIEINTLSSQGYDVEVADMITYLKKSKQKFSSISALQVIEHIDYDTLKTFITLSYKKIQKGGVIILETINPHNKVTFNSFYMDETHKRPLPPEMVAFMLQFYGFKDIRFVYTSPMPKEFRNKHHLNINYHDYAVVGYKI